MVFKKKKEKIKFTHDEEFQLFKLVMDKYLWLGTFGFMFGIYSLLNPAMDWGFGLLVTFIGAMILLMFTSFVSKNIEYKSKN